MTNQKIRRYTRARGGLEWVAKQAATAPQSGPGRGSQPGNLTGRHALEEQEMCEVRDLRVALIDGPTSSDGFSENRPFRGSFVPDEITPATRPSMTHGERSNLPTLHTIYAVLRIS